MTMAMQSDDNSRLTDLCDEPVDHLLSSIKGYSEKLLVRTKLLFVKTFSKEQRIKFLKKIRKFCETKN